MTAVLANASVSDEHRRDLLYQGNVFTYPSSEASRALIDFANDLVTEAFGGLDPETAQYEMEVGDYAALLADLKPRFIHHPRCKELLPEVLRDLGYDLARTYFDVPRMRTSTSNDYLTSGIAYAFHPHRDCWYSAPFSQLNHWIPIYPVVPENVMAFHVRYFDRAVRNGSARYDYAEWNRTSRATAAQHINKDTRVQPKPEEDIELDPQVRVVPRARRDHDLLRGAAALHRPQHLRQDTIQHRLPDGLHRRRADASGRPECRRGVHGNHPA